MLYPNNYAAVVLDAVDKMIKNPQEDDSRKVHRLWATLHITQAQNLATELRTKLDSRVFGGPFRGMKLTAAATNGSSAPVLLGTYETELHDEIEKIINHPYQQILNIGCSWGYYSTGLALRMPHVTIQSYDIDPKARANCLEMIRLNNVDGRVQIGGQFFGDDFERFTGKETLVLMDIEGGETALLDPVKYPALQKMDILVELHDLFDPTISKTIMDRFAQTHDIAYYVNRTTLPDLTGLVPPEVLVDPIDHFLMGWENRGGSTPWAVMRYKR